jgi:hypothetical protein
MQGAAPDYYGHCVPRFMVCVRCGGQGFFCLVQTKIARYPSACWGSQYRSGRFQRKLSRFTLQFGQRSIRACRAAAALRAAPATGPYQPHCSAPTSTPDPVSVDRT